MQALPASPWLPPVSLTDLLSASQERIVVVAPSAVPRLPQLFQYKTFDILSFLRKLSRRARFLGTAQFGIIRTTSDMLALIPSHPASP